MQILWLTGGCGGKDCTHSCTYNPWAVRAVACGCTGASATWVQWRQRSLFSSVSTCFRYDHALILSCDWTLAIYQYPKRLGGAGHQSWKAAFSHMPMLWAKQKMWDLWWPCHEKQKGTARLGNSPPGLLLPCCPGNGLLGTATSGAASFDLGKGITTSCCFLSSNNT